MAACQNEGALNPQEKTFSVTAEVSVPQTRTAISPDGDSYKPTWTAGDRIGVVEKAAATKVYASDALAAAAESASFAVTMTESSASAYTYCAVYPYEAFKTTADVNALVCTLPSEQAPATMTSFDGNADILVSELVDRTSQPVDGKLAFSMRRLSATGMVSFKNLQLMSGEKVTAWTIKTALPMAGTVTVNPADAELAFAATQAANSVKVTLPEAQEGDFTSCFTCLPCTLAAGTEYEVTVHTTLRNLTKTAVVNTPLVFTAGKVMEFGVSMALSTTTVKVEQFSDKYDYAITATVGEKTYILPNASVNRNPALVEISAAGLTIGANGSLVGEVAEAYRWQANSYTEEVEGNTVVKVKFQYTNANGAILHLINGNKNQGLAIKVAEEDGSYVGHYSNDGVLYYDYFTVTELEGGYSLYGDGRYVAIDETNKRWACAGSASTIRFHRINKATINEEIVAVPVETKVVTRAEDVKAGKYVVVGYNNVRDTYYLLDGTPIAKNTVPVPAEDKGICILEDKLITALPEVDNLYVWEIAAGTTAGYWTLKNLSTENHLFGKITAQGVAVATEAAATDWFNEWIFSDSETGLQATVNGSTARWIAPYFVSEDLGMQWRMPTNQNCHILLIPINE